MPKLKYPSSVFRFALIATLTSCSVATSLSSATAQEKIKATMITGEQIELSNLTIKDGMIANGDEQVDLNQITMIEMGKVISDAKPNTKVFFAGGGTLNANSVSFAGEQFIATCSFGNLRFPPDAVKGVLFKPEADQSRFQRALGNRSVEQDIVIADRGDGQGSVEGLVESIDSKQMKVNVRGKSRKIFSSKLVGVVTADLKPRKPEGTIGTIKLTNGSTLIGAVKNLEQGALQLQLMGNANIELKTNLISSISLQSDRVVYLSDLEPTDVEEGSLATVSFPWQRDRNALGDTMRMVFPSTRSMKTYSRGIGTHAASRLEFANEKDFDRLSGVVGIDASTDGKGDCVVSVWGDGIKLWEKEINGEGEPEELDLDISGMERVALVVRNGRNLDLGDHVNWANIRFLNTAD